MVQGVLGRSMAKGDHGNNFMQIYSILAVSVGTFSTGAQVAWPSPSMPRLLDNSSYIGQVTINEASYFSILPPVTIIVFSIFIGNVTKSIGRKYIIGFMAIPHIISWSLIATAKSVTSIYISRAIGGISDAITYSTVAIYVGEISTPTIRGRWGSLPTCAILLGHLSVGLVGTYCDIPMTASVFIFPPLMQLLMLVFVPESPYFLIMHGQPEKAKASLKLLRWKHNVDEEFYTISANIQNQISKMGTLKDLFCIPVHRKALGVNTGLRICQQFSGLSAFIIYLQYIFELAGAKSISAEMSSIIIYSVLFFLSISSLPAIDKCGRRIMLIVSSLGCTISLLVNTIYFYIMDETQIDVSELNWLPLVGMTCYIAFLSIGLTPIPILMTGELFSATIKNHAMFISTIVRALTIICAPAVLQLLLVNFDIYVAFMFFTFACLLSTIFCYYCVPETKGKTLDEIQCILSGK